MRLIRVLAAGLVALLLSRGAFAACDQQSIGKAKAHTHKAAMNILKNRMPTPTLVRPISVEEVLSYPDAEDLNLETFGAVLLSGQLLQRVPEGPESPNCGSAFDYHVFIGRVDTAHPQGRHLTKARIKLLKKHAVVVELTPNVQALHPDWGGSLESLVGKNVCITGYLLYDYEHHPQVGHTRGTLWEVHPITGIGLLQPDRSCEPWHAP
jgi:hypothetical protein